MQQKAHACKVNVSNRTHRALTDSRPSRVSLCDVAVLDDLAVANATDIDTPDTSLIVALEAMNDHDIAL